MTAAGLRAQPSRIAAAAFDSWDMTGRNVRALLRNPAQVIFAVVQPVLFVLLFRYAFGGAIHIPGPTPYVDYLMPGIFAQAVAFGCLGTAVGLAYDLKAGLLERFRTLPMSRTAILAGRTLADLGRNIAVVAVMAAVGFAVGFRIHTNAVSFAAALALVALFAFALSWGFVALGLAIKDPEAAQGAGVPVMFILVFASPAFVPLQAMPGWLQAIGSRQPLTALVSAERALTLGGPAAGDVLASLTWSAAMLAGFAAVATSLYRRIGS